MNDYPEKNMDLVQIYNKLDLELSKTNPGCGSCGSCCHFDTFGHKLYASTIETNYILDNVYSSHNGFRIKSEIKLSEYNGNQDLVTRKSENQIGFSIDVPPFDPKQGTCPFLVEKKCTIREYRTLGCRVFFCNPDYKETSYEIYDKYYKMIKALAVKNQIEWHYAPMLDLLANSDQSSEIFPACR